ncbi:UDP-N-acetylmuramate dehydrogenase [Mediannikoviicoccus vaginalis]|uniref:UDP-N-acetylmuramate dehydrogenase n=1 Tax=Mediannikoviicoccus vaginalis TaxID=2899727 RepID=UPI001F018ACA|nr:UDP-N-acetylmuramate dehydrogenase [Mediannikoviicoccus vaginalis]
MTINYKDIFSNVDVGEVLYDEPMKNHTTFKIGGPCDVLVMPNTIEQILNVLNLVKENDLAYMIIGNGSNLLVSDQGIRKVIVKLHKNFSKITLEENKITSQAGATLKEIADFALENKLQGFEFASGIPGDLGGAVTMNAGAYGGEMKDVLESVKVIDKDLNVIDIDAKDMNLRYRNSRVQDEGLIVLEAVINLSEGDYDKIKEYQDELTFKRESKQPLEFPSAGSTFKRPEGYYAGKLIDDCGLRGYRYKDAMVSEKHCGFVINAGDANCEQVLYVINHVKEVVFEKFGVNLEPEVRIIGEFKK